MEDDGVLYSWALAKKSQGERQERHRRRMEWGTDNVQLITIAVSLGVSFAPSVGSAAENKFGAFLA